MSFERMQRLSMPRKIIVAAVTIVAGLVGIGCNDNGSTKERTEVLIAPLNLTPQSADFVVEAQNSVRLQTGSVVNGGDVGAHGTGSGTYLSGGVTIDALTGAKIDKARNVIADSVKLGTGVTVGDIQTNRLVSGTGSKHGDVSGIVPLPQLPVAFTVSPGTTNLTVGSGATVLASAGHFATISVGTGGKLRLGGGIYDAADLNVSTGARVEALGPVQLHIANRLSASSGVFIGAASGTSMTARDLRIEVSGQNGSTGGLAETPPAASLGTGDNVTALVLVPNGTLVIGTGVTGIGAFMGRDVDVGGSGAKLVFQDGFPNCTAAVCDDGNPCTVDACSASADCTHSDAPSGTVCGNHETCQSGVCSVAACDSGYADCNVSAADGCETDTSTDTSNCGACGNTCTFPNAYASCTNGSCSFSVCMPGFGDCDCNPANGCEANLNTDSANCGGCNFSCGGATCSVGSCARPSVAMISAGAYDSCAVLSDGTLQCWGYGNATYSSVPVTVTGAANVSRVALGYGNSGVVLENGKVECWGLNRYGQLGNGTTTDSQLPVTVAGITNATDLAVAGDPNGDGFACAVLRTGTVECWGHNDRGQLGSGGVDSSPTPVTVSGITDAVGITAGYYHVCALLRGGTIQCWGNNGSGELGSVSCTDPFSFVPVAVSGINNAVGVAAGYNYTCALLNDGTARCWGNNDNDRLGDGTTNYSVAPVTVAGVSDAIAMTANLYHTCVLLRSGAIQCWGVNLFGDLGNGTTADPYSVVMVANITDAVAVAAGGLHTCALLGDSTVQCWGFNYYGELGNGTQVDSYVPVNVAGY